MALGYRWLAVLLSFFISSCGEDVFIADQIKFRADFQKKTLRTSFLLNSRFDIPQTSHQQFESLGVTFLIYHENLPTTELGSVLRVSPEVLVEDWGGKPFKRFQNGKSLPSYLDDFEIWKWTIEQENEDFGLLYTPLGALATGGSYRTSAFNDLPERFLARQDFKAGNREVEASIFILGPTEEKDSEIVFIANFGENPFEANYRSSDPLALSALAEEWTLEAEEPAKIINKGRGWRKLYRLLNKNK